MVLFNCEIVGEIMEILVNFNDIVCGGADVLRILRFVFILLDMVCWIVPMGLIVMLMVDFGKNVIAGKEDEMKKNLNMVIKRIIYCIILFLVPTIVNFAVGIVSNVGVEAAKCIEIARDHNNDLSQYEIDYDTFEPNGDYEGENVFYVSFDSNGGTIPSISQKYVKFGEKYGELPVTSRLGYEFLGWYTSKIEGEGERVTSTSRVNVKNSHMLYARWEKKDEGYNDTHNFVIVKLNFYDEKYGFCQWQFTTSYGEKYGDGYGIDLENKNFKGLPIPKDNIHNLDFDGWYTKEGDKVTNEKTVSNNTTHNLYARWKNNNGENVIHLSLRAKQSGYPSEASYVSNNSINSNSTYLEFEYLKNNIVGYTLYADELYKNQIKEDSKITVFGDHRLYIYYNTIKNNIYVSFDSNGGTEPTKSQKKVEFGSRYGELPVTSRVGYEFLGWYKSKIGGEVAPITSGTYVTEKKSHILYARWKKKKIKVTFDTDGGTVSPSYKTYDYGSKYNNLPIPTKDGYNFEGWYKDSNYLDGVNDSTNVSIDKDHSLYAKWKGQKVIVTLRLVNLTNNKYAECQYNVIYGKKYGEGTGCQNRLITFKKLNWVTEYGEPVEINTIVNNKMPHILYSYFKME